MGSNERGAIISAGLTGSFGAVLAGLNLAFPDMIVPFGWALTLLVVGLLGALVTIAYATLWLIQPKSRRQRIQAGLRPHLEILTRMAHQFKAAQTYEEVKALIPDMDSALSAAGNWIRENMAPAAFEKFKTPPTGTTAWSFPGEGSIAAEHRSNIVVLNEARLDVLDTFLRYDGWDGEDPSWGQRIKRKVAKWKKPTSASTSF